MSFCFKILGNIRQFYRVMIDKNARLLSFRVMSFTYNSIAS